MDIPPAPGPAPQWAWQPGTLPGATQTVGVWGVWKDFWHFIAHGAVNDLEAAKNLTPWS